jgi:hypothetical protein
MRGAKPLAALKDYNSVGSVALLPASARTLLSCACGGYIMLNTAFTARLIFPMLFSLLASPANLTGDLSPVDRTELCVTSGTISPETGTYLEITDPEVRTVLRHLTGQNVEVKFKYLGPTDTIHKLGSGEMGRLQFGLKLRAADSCNLVYAMWRTGPKAKAGLAVMVKRNAGMTLGKECGNNGYTTVKFIPAPKVPPFHKGERHAMRAEITIKNIQQVQTAHLQVWIDGKSVWDGDLPQIALEFDGPVGIRSDNVKVQFELLAPPLGAAVECHASQHENE